MTPLLRAIAPVATALALTLLGAGSAEAQDYPSKPVKIVVPFGAGGPADVYSRVLAQHLSEALKQSFVVENRPGAGSIIGSDAVAKSAPDGHTLLTMSNTHTTNETLTPNKPFVLMRDFVPVAAINYSDLVMVVHPSVAAKDLEEFIALAKSKPGGMSYASTGNGSGLHLSMELLKSMAGIDLVHVPYKGGGVALTDLLSGNVQAMFVSYGTGNAQIKAGKIRVLAVTSSQRSPALPDVPTIAEAGVPGYESGVWYALLAPHGTPPEIVKRLHDGSVAALQSKELRERFASDGVKDRKSVV